MKDGSTSNHSTYFNQFIDMKKVFPMKSRQKNRNNNQQKIKIATKKLPPDFFRPHTRDNQLISQPFQRDQGTKTPCFGDEKKQSSSLSLIPKQKGNLELYERRIHTLPIQENPSNYKQIRKNFTQQHARNQQQLSYRQSNTRTVILKQPRQRQKIKYKKLTLNDQLYLDEKKMLNLQYENRIRLNIKNFFQEEASVIVPQMPSKSARKVPPLDKISSTQLPYKLKVKKLPPLL